MLTLIAESKTMTPCDRKVTNPNFPVGEPRAVEIMERIARMTVPELAAIARFSPAMAAKAIALAYEFPNKTLGQHAIEAFTGVVFKSLDYPTLAPEAQTRVNTDVRLLSSLYGYLCPEVIIKAYRLDYTTPIAPDNRPLSAFWKKDATLALIRELKTRATERLLVDSGHSQLDTCNLAPDIQGDRTDEAILNLLPADAAKMIDWKLVKHFAPVYKVDFKELRDSSILERLPDPLTKAPVFPRSSNPNPNINPNLPDQYPALPPEISNIPTEYFKTPNSNRLKELRGHLLREIATRHITTPRDLLTLETDYLLPLGTPDYPDHIAFLA